MANPLLAWQAVIDRLKTVAGLRAVEPLPRFFAADSLAAFPTPTAFVGYGGDTVTPTYGRSVTQTYVVWLMERNSRDLANLEACIQIGELVDEVDRLICDFNPGDQYSPFERVNAGDPVQYFPGGLVIYPLWYQTHYTAED